MAILPKHILKAIMSNDTSLGDHPAFPPEDEEKFIAKMLSAKYLDVTDGIPVDDMTQLQNELSQMLSECMKKESECKEALEKLCGKVVTEIFSIPEDTIQIECKLVSNVDSSSHRMIPEKTDDFEFDSIEDMRNLSDRVYQRRMVDALVAGAACYYASKMENYLQDLFDINPELPQLYKKITRYNLALLYALDLSKQDSKQSLDGGKVDVYIGNDETMISVKSEGIIFPALLEETIKGILEIAVMHGLPEDKKKASFIMKKADFKAAELWDLRLGLPLWEKIMDICEDDVEPNFLLMELSQFDCDKFNDIMGNIFAHTNKGKVILKEITTSILKQQGLDDFNQFIDMQNAQFPIEDSVYSPEELIADDYFDEEDLLMDDEI